MQWMPHVPQQLYGKHFPTNRIAGSDNSNNNFNFQSELENGRPTLGCLAVQPAIRLSLLRRLLAHW